MLRWLWLSVVVIAIDQITKYWAEHILKGDVIPILPIFDFSLVHNPGAAFGFLGGLGGMQHYIFFVLAFAVCVWMFFELKKLANHERHLAIAYSLIVAGAIGNVIDRMIYSYVVDFIHFYYKQWHYPHFNVADIAIFIGAALLISEALGKPFLNTRAE